MSLFRRKVFRLAASVGMAPLLCVSLLAQALTNPPLAIGYWLLAIGYASVFAQAPTSPPASTATNAATGSAGVSPASLATKPPALTTTNASRPGPPLPPVPAPPKSPVSFFRELLAMTPIERKQFLADRPPETQKLLLAKVREYESLKPDQRELRLRATELRWYLWPLMSTPATDRTAQLAAIPEDQRKLVEDRLKEWDKLSPDVQSQLLKNEATIRYFSEIEAGTEEQKQRILESISPARRQKLEEGIAEWRALTEEQRQKLLKRFNQFFNLTPQEQKEALGTLSEPERRQIDKTLHQFEKLSPAQRVQCIRSFQKFASLSLEERQQFLKNAQRWKLMSPNERQAWKDLVSRLPLQPPPPPGFRAPLPPPPPPVFPRPAGSVATNGH